MAVQGQTRLQVVNAVLQRLRESTVATTSTNTYSALIAQLVDTVKDQIEAAWTWRDLRDTYSITCTPGTTLYTLTSAGQYARILDMWNVTTATKMALGTFADFNNKFFGVTTVQTGHPTMYLPAGLDASYDLQLDIWPSPSTTDSLKANVYVPQAGLTNDATVILIPNQPLIEGVYALALAERGDDNGTNLQNQQALYEQMLRDAIGREMGRDESEFDWHVV